MKRGCILSLLLWGALAAAYWFYLHGRVPPPSDKWGTFAGSLATLLGIGCFRNVLHAMKEVRLLSQARFSRPSNTAGLTALSGTIEVKGEPLAAPFSNTACAFCSYEIYDKVTTRNSQGSSTQKRLYYSGILMVSSVLRTAGGDYDLCGFPVLHGFPEEPVGGQEGYARAQSFISTTSFEELQGVQLMKVISQAKDLMTDDDGIITKNLKLKHADDLSELRLQEQCIPVHTEVCATGLFDPVTRSLRADLSKSGTALQIYKGGPKEVTSLLNKRIVGYTIGAIFFIAGGNAFLMFALNQFAKSLQ